MVASISSAPAALVGPSVPSVPAVRIVIPGWFSSIIAEIEALLKSKSNPTFKNTILTFDNTGDLLSKVSQVFFAQAAANTNDSLQKIEMEISPKLSAYRDEILLNPELFSRVKSVFDNQAEFKLNPEQKFLLENLYKGFVRNGANLNKQDQDTLKVLNQKLSVLTVKFSQNVLSETNNYLMYVNKEDLTGLPESVIATAAETAKEAGQEGKWAFTTQRPSIFPFLQYSESFGEISISIFCSESFVLAAA